jgi:hypothetical protein
MDTSEIKKVRAMVARCVLVTALVVPGAFAAAEPGNAGAVLTLASADIAGFNASPDEHVYRRQLIGLFVDDVERSGLFALTEGDTFLLPLDKVLQDVGATLEQRGQETWVVTPAGEIKLDGAALRTVENQLMIRMEALNDQLQLRARFDQTSYALHISPPWSQTTNKSSTGAFPTARFTPPTASLRNMRADFTYFTDDESSDFYGEYFTAGNLAGGTWQTRIEQDPDNEFTPFDYYWHRAWEQTQLLVGNSNYSLHPLVPTIEQTGAIGIISNKSFATESSRGITGADGARNLGAGTRTIGGNGEPGAIAELRINGGVVARTRVRLDGTYDFDNIDVPTRGAADIKVLMLDRSSGVLLDTYDFSRRGGSGMLAGGQHTLFTALGEEGNPADDRRDSRGTAAAVQWRYGVSDHLTVEAGHQDSGDIQTSLAGASVSFAKHWFSSLTYAEADETDALEFTLDGGRDNWEFNYSDREYWTDREQEQGHQWVRYGNYRYQTSRRLNVGLSGRDARTRYQDEQFVLPTVTWNDGHLFSVSAWPNIDGNYRVDSRLTPTREDSVRYTYEESNHFVDYRHRTRRNLEYYANFRDGDDFETRTEAGVIHYSENPLYERSQVGLVAGDGEFGFVAQWDARILPGVYSRLRMSDNAYNNESFDIDPGFTVQWDVTLDFALVRGRAVPADTNRGRPDSAALTGPLQINGEALSGKHGVTRVVLIVDGASYTAVVQAGQYYVDGLPAGLHRVSLESRFLPIELVPKRNQVYWVELGRGAATSVPFALEVRYAIAGKVLGPDGAKLAGVQITIYNQAGDSIRTLSSDQFGFYRADDLAPGEYRIEARKDNRVLSERPVIVTDSFLFDQDLIVR